jgi:hypothetical protein
MNVPEGTVFECSNCAWMQKAEVPEDKKKEYPSGRGYCTFEPPRVFPMPQQQGKLADIQGKVQMGFLPLMMDPVVDGDKPACGRYSPSSEMRNIIEEAQPEGCKVEGCGGHCGTK